jgi:hypothetical protein
MSGLATATVVVGLLCLAGAVAAAFLLPGRLTAPAEDVWPVDPFDSEPDPAAAAL